MSFMFNPTCPCCPHCFKNLMVICIYDESEPVYTSGITYTEDLEQWNTFIDELEVSTVVMGIIQPQGSLIKKADAPYPHDSLGQIIHTQLPNQTPRVKKEDIYDFFVLLKGDLKMNLLVFALDNSGSITVNTYRAELEAAKEMIKEEFPKVKILDDLSNAGERWVRDAFVSADKRTCG